MKRVTGGWRVVDAFNKFNDATIAALMQIPRKDVVLDTMAGTAVFSPIDVLDGFYQSKFAIVFVIEFGHF